jgi:predicted nucleic acid-binding Zn ribbon protein
LPRCWEIIERVRASGKPAIIFYISDFDPGGQSMPVAAARKLEFLAQGLGLDIQVRPVVLTYEQCVEFQLPRTPLKDTETRAAKFEERFGEGGTELDALEALHPGELERILTREVERYYDLTLNRRVDRRNTEVSVDLVRIDRRIRERHADEIAALEANRAEIAAEVERMRERIDEMKSALKAQAEPLFDTIMEELEDEAPDVDDYEWPEPKDADEDPDPLFDSTRDYLDQIGRYKAQQGKRIKVLQPHKYKRLMAMCANPSCGKEFEATVRAAVKVCSRACREAVRRQKNAPAPIPCSVCGKPFHSIRGAVTCSDKCRKAQRRRERAAGQLPARQ